MSLSQLARTIHESATLKLNQTAAQLREKGEPVIHLGGGEPKSKTPIDAIVACTGVLNSGDIKYTPVDGIPALKKAIIRYTEEHYSRVVKPANVIASSGAKQSIMVLLHSILDPKDEVIFPAPYWVSYPEMVKLAGGVPVVVTAEDGSFCPTIEEFEAAMGSYTKAVILNSPNNPSGVMYPPEFVADLVQLCEKRDIWLIMDDTYNRLVFDGRQPVNCYEYTKTDIEQSKMVVINCVSKMYAMTGFRIGWAVAPKALVKVLANIQAQTVSCTSGLLQAAAEGALSGPASDLEALRAALQGNRDAMMAALAAVPKVKAAKPSGTFYCLPDFRAYGQDSAALARLLLEKALVVTVPGNEFGMEGHLRLSYCTSAADVAEGVARIRWALDPSSPKEIVIGGKKAVRDWL